MSLADVLWWGIGPWHKTGYGKMTDLFTERIRDLGHDVAIAIMGQRGKNHPLEHPDAKVTKVTGKWKGMPVIGPGLTEFGIPSPSAIRGAFGGKLPDLVIVLKDAWVLDPDALKRFPNVILWLAFDCEPMGVPDRVFFENAPHAVPACLSRWGMSWAQRAGLSKAVYLPHGIDTGFWTPGDTNVSRETCGLPRDRFIAGIDAHNSGNFVARKGWGQQFAAFADLRDKDALLLVHADPDNKNGEGINLRHLAYQLGLCQSDTGPTDGDRVMFGKDHNETEADMLNWYRSIDVLMSCTYGEGFGLPIVQALSVGKPVIGTRCTAITEKLPAGMGWTVPGQRFWNPHHQSWWQIPDIPSITRALGKAAAGKHSPPSVIHEFAVAEYDADDITARYWKPLIEEMTDGRR